jgi:Raf kinase inhibitor-like YbhB/YbcL family protein
MTQPEKHLVVESDDIVDGRVDVVCTCDGENRPIHVRWSDPPEGTESFAVIVDDPDAPKPHFVHWLVWNIPRERRSLKHLVQCKQGTNDFGRMGWGGPCPPHGAEHRYVIRVYALDKVLDLDDAADRDDLMEAMRDHVLARGELEGLYERMQYHRPSGPATPPP